MILLYTLKDFQCIRLREKFFDFIPGKSCRECYYIAQDPFISVNYIEEVSEFFTFKMIVAVVLSLFPQLII